MALMFAEPGEALSSYEKRVAFMEILKAKPGYWLARLFFEKQNFCVFLNKFEQIGAPPFPHPGFTSRRVWNAEVRAIQQLIRQNSEGKVKEAKEKSDESKKKSEEDRAKQERREYSIAVLEEVQEWVAEGDGV